MWPVSLPWKHSFPYLQNLLGSLGFLLSSRAGNIFSKYSSRVLLTNILLLQVSPLMAFASHRSWAQKSEGFELLPEAAIKWLQETG